jgi:succinoglycan biosynthesis transport protein ExoP
MMSSPGDGKAAPTVQDAVAFLRRRRTLFFLVAIPMILGTIVLAFKLPPIYRSDAKVLIERPAIPADVVPSLITSYIDERIQEVTQRVMAADNVLSIIDENNLYREYRQAGMEQDAVEMFREDTFHESIAAEIYDPRRGRMDGSTYAFVVGFQNSDPVVAQKVTSTLVQLYLDENVRSRTEMSAETTSFLEGEAARAAAKMSAMEFDIAEYKGKHAEALPERLQLNVQTLERAERELNQVENDIRELNSQKNRLQFELESTQPYAIAYSESGAPVLTVEDRLAVLQMDYLRLNSLYGAEHPDVVRTKREIDAIMGGRTLQTPLEVEQQLAVLRVERDQLMDRYSAEHPDVLKNKRSITTLEAQYAEMTANGYQSTREIGPPTNPAYVQKKLELDTVTVNLDASYQQRGQLRSRLQNTENNISIAPRIEKEWLELNRGYNIAKQEYEQLQARIAEAKMSERLESQNKGERFTLLDRAGLPRTPLEPNRPAIIFLGFVLALGVGIGLAALVDGLDSTVRSESDLEGLLSMGPLVSIPYVNTVQDIRARWIRRISGFGALVASIALIMVWI